MRSSSVNDVAFNSRFRSFQKIVRLDAYVIGYYDVCAEKGFGKNDTDDVVTKNRNCEK